LESVLKIGLLAFRRDASQSGSTSHYVHHALGLGGENEVCHLAASQANHFAGKHMMSRLRRRFMGMVTHPQALERKYIKRAIRDAEDMDCDIILGCFCSNGSDLLEKTSIPVVYLTDINATQLEGYDPEKNSAKVALEKGMYELSAACVFPSKFVADSAIHDYGIESSRVHVVEWGGAEIGEKGGPLTEGHVRASHPTELLFIGHQRYRKGLDRAIRAVESLNAAGHEVRLVTIGRTDQMAIDSDFVDDLGWLDLNHAEDSRKFEEAFRRATCLIHPARSEPYGHVLVEACARSLPVVCTSVGGMPQIIRHEVNGLLIDEPFEQRALEVAVERLVTDPELVSRLGGQAYAQWQNRLNWSSWLEQVQPILESNLVSREPQEAVS
jgi:glycosyltransferase involved in cell wall biosynthesis